MLTYHTVNTSKSLFLLLKQSKVGSKCILNNSSFEPTIDLVLVLVGSYKITVLQLKFVRFFKECKTQNKLKTVFVNLTITPIWPSQINYGIN